MFAISFYRLPVLEIELKNMRGGGVWSVVVGLSGLASTCPIVAPVSRYKAF